MQYRRFNVPGKNYPWHPHDPTPTFETYVYHPQQSDAAYAENAAVSRDYWPKEVQHLVGHGKALVGQGQQILFQEPANIHWVKKMYPRHRQRTKGMPPAYFVPEDMRLKQEVARRIAHGNATDQDLRIAIQEGGGLGAFARAMYNL